LLPAGKLIVAAPVQAVPPGKTDTEPAVGGASRVTFAVTALAPAATPAWPATGKVSAWPAPIGWLVLVSSTRARPSGTKVPGCGAVASVAAEPASRPAATGEELTNTEPATTAATAASIAMNLRTYVSPCHSSSRLLHHPTGAACS